MGLFSRSSQKETLEEVEAKIRINLAPHDPPTPTSEADPEAFAPSAYEVALARDTTPSPESRETVEYLPVLDRIIVRPLEEKHVGTIHVEANEASRTRLGIVVAVGPDVRLGGEIGDGDTYFIEDGRILLPGAEILFGRYAGVEVERRYLGEPIEEGGAIVRPVLKETVVIIRDEDVLTVVSRKLIDADQETA